MGWIIALVLAALTFAALWLSGKCSRLALEMAAAALLVGLAGYGWQASPSLVGNPTQPTPAASPAESG